MLPAGVAADGSPSGRDGPHVFVDTIDAPTLGAEDEHHLRRVLRLRVGATLTASDGRGAWRLCELGDGPELRPISEPGRVARASPALTVGFALTKGEKPELVVQKLTELGIDRIVPFVAARSVVRWDAAKAARNVARLRRVAREASMQSRRCVLPEVTDVTAFARLAGEVGAAIAERDGPPLGPEVTAILVGPEGGWAPDERASAPRSVGLGTTVLRAETAAVAAGTLLAATRAGLVHPATLRGQ